MEKEASKSRVDFGSRVRTAKSQNLRQRLFEVGVSSSPKKNSNQRLHTLVASPKARGVLNNPLNSLPRQNSEQLLKYQPAQMQLNKSQGK